MTNFVVEDYAGSVPFHCTGTEKVNPFFFFFLSKRVQRFATAAVKRVKFGFCVKRAPSGAACSQVRFPISSVSGFVYDRRVKIGDSVNLHAFNAHGAKLVWFRYRKRFVVILIRSTPSKPSCFRVRLRNRIGSARKRVRTPNANVSVFGTARDTFERSSMSLRRRFETLRIVD